MLRLEHITVKKLRVFVALAEGRDPRYEVPVTYRTYCRYAQEVETLSGYKLFEGKRTPKNLTKEGKVFYLHIKAAINEFNRLEQVISERGTRW